MFGKKIKIFKLFGFEVWIDFSWIFIAVLIVWSLSGSLFPRVYEGLTPKVYWTMGVLGAVGLFLSIIFHEFSHSLVARRYGLPMKGITLFIFGGVAEMGEEPRRPKAEFMMAAAGPAASLVVGLVFWGVSGLGKLFGWPRPVTGVLGYISSINFLLAAFNLVPAFPLDGGRILRSILWGWKNNLRWATRISSRIGSAFGIALIILGVLNVLNGNFVGGMWWFLIGMFLNGAAKSAHQQLVTRQLLEGEPVRRFMKTNPVTAPPTISVKQFVEDYVYRHHFKMFPIVEGARILGCVTTKQIKEIPQEEWNHAKVGDLAAQCSPSNSISPETDAVKALAIMNSSGASRLMVIEGDRLVGVLALKDLLEFLSLKVELEG